MDNEWNRRYTEDSLIEELALLERHFRDGSYRECTCVPEKHLPLIAGLASEMLMFLQFREDKLKKFYENLADVARKARTNIEEGKFDYMPSNPSPREYLPSALTELEKADPKLKHKIASCIKKVEKSSCPSGFVSYEECKVNPVAVCRASIEKH